jgi:ATP-dependent helicase HrpB
MKPLPDLPVGHVLPALLDALDRRAQAVLVAPPGAGKTTLVPLALLEAPWRRDGRILLLEPRRIAARAAARRMAELLGEEVGGTVGYAMRLDSRMSAKTRILVVTEGVLARMILDDPELPGIAAILFDEFHERSLDGDFGLALALDARALRPDLRLLVMSATIDGARVARLLDNAPVIESEGRAFPVEIIYRERPPGVAIEDHMADAIRSALPAHQGSLLAFLPGQREIERTAERLEGRLPANIDLYRLYGGLDGKAQDEAIRPAPAGRRKVVLATAIAETSITIDGVTTIIDSGLSRLPKFEPATGLTRLETVRVGRASADQRAGRAGRTAPGVAIRLWRAEQTAALPAFTPPEILEADLTGLLLDCAAFGVSDPATLAFLDPPPVPALAEARKLLSDLGALDAAGQLTPDGKAMRQLALPARLAHMAAAGAAMGAAQSAAELAVLLTERGLGGDAVDLERRLERFRRDRSPRAQAARGLARRIAGQAGGAGADASPSPGSLLVHAWPDRVARARGAPGRFVLANGTGAAVEETDPLARAPYLVIADLQGRAQQPRIAAAAEIGEADLLAALPGRIGTHRVIDFDIASKSLRAREERRLGAIVLSDRRLPAPSGEAAEAALVAAIREHGLKLLPWSGEAAALRARLGWLRRGLGGDWPDMGDEALLAGLESWLKPWLGGASSLAGLSPARLAEALMSLVPFALQRDVGRLAPTRYTAPTGNSFAIDYERDMPTVAIRVQELFGLREHPSVAGGRVPLTLELLSPAHRPIQTTADLPGFWTGSWRDVRADMRGRYPKHVWPEDPMTALPTARARPRQ